MKKTVLLLSLRHSGLRLTGLSILDLLQTFD
jgi:hypothetical protein